MLDRVLNRTPARTDDVAWYAIDVDCHESEYRSIEETAEIRIRQKGFSTFLPMAAHKVRRHSKKRKPTQVVIKPILPGYVFVAMPRFGADWSRLKRLSVVQGVVLSEGVPAAFDLSVLLHFQALVQNRSIGRTSIRGRLFQAGDKVQIVSGDGSDRRSVVDEITGSTAHLWIYLHGKRRIIETDVDNIFFVK